MNAIHTIVVLCTCAALGGCSAAQTPGERSPVRSASAGAPSTNTPATRAPLPDRFAAWLKLYDEAGFPDVARLERIDRFNGIVQSVGGATKGLRDSAWVVRRSPFLKVLYDTLWQEDVAPQDAPISAPMGVPPSMRRPCDSAWCDPVKRRAHLKDTPGAEPLERPADFAAELEAALVEAEKLAADPDAREAARAFPDGRLGPHEVLWVVRARWAEERGRRDLALRALAEAERILKETCQDPSCDPIDKLREGFQQKLLWQAVDGLGAWMPRSQVLDLARRARAMAPKGRLAASAEAHIAALEQAVAEDGQRARSGPVMGDKLTADQRAEELIFLLREQNGHQMSQPGACDPFDVGSGVRSPAQELVAMGRAIVPRLIPHVASSVPTRSIGYHRDFHFSHHALTVGEVALVIVERVTGRSFARQGKTPDALRAEIAAWWARASSMSEKEMLIDALKAADAWERAGIAQKILATSGMEMFDELVRAYQGTKEPGARSALVQVLSHGARAAMERVPKGARATQGASSGDRVVRFLVDALRDTAPEVRRVAALELTARGDARGTDYLIRDLTVARDPAGTSSYEVGQTVRQLLEAPNARAVDAIAREIRKGNTGVISGVSDALGGVCPSGNFPPESCKLDAPQKAQLLDALAERMMQTSEAFDGSIGSGLRRPRDQAARAFAILRRLPDEDFWSNGAFEADRAILTMLNGYRAQQKKPAIVAPELEVPPRPASPGPDDHRTVRRVHEQSDGAGARALGAAWLARYQGRPLDAGKVAVELFELAAKDTSIAWKLRIVRLPEERGIVLFLRGWQVPSQGNDMSHYAFDCAGSEACAGGTMQGGGIKSAAPKYGKGILQAWQKSPKGGEEQTLTIREVK
jgi:hypothetical protein